MAKRGRKKVGKKHRGTKVLPVMGKTLGRKKTRRKRA